MIGLKERRETG